MYSEALKPGAALGPYPERQRERRSVLDRAVARVAGRVSSQPWLSRGRARRFLKLVERHGEPLRDVLAKDLTRLVRDVRAELLQHGLVDDVVARTFALVREIAHRTLGTRHYDCQIIGGWVILNGMFAEMETGEGKTLTATLPASVAALAGIPVHVITTNDYLASRDAEAMFPLYAILGLCVGAVTSDMSAPDVRRAVYAGDITYCTNKQIAFDYLRDRVMMGDRRGRLNRLIDGAQAGDATRQPILRGLCFGIVDEADSVLIDEARTPLILSREIPEMLDPQIYREALVLARQLEAGVDFLVDDSNRTVRLTDVGRDTLTCLCAGGSEFWQRRRHREDLIIQALRAIHQYFRDRHYLVHEDKVQIVDENTGRLMPDRSWEGGLHQLIETKECVDITPGTETIAKISYQKFFHRYIRLGAMSGTASEVAGEIWSTYGLRVVKVPTHRPLQRTAGGTRVFATAEQKWQWTVSRIRTLHELQRPILIGTRSVEASELLSVRLTEAKLPHAVLNARHHADEAKIIAGAGQPGRITIATNMAGRGTDIVLADGVADLGGLHVVMTEHNDAKRIDRQLYGRCGRQGDPGSFEAIMSLEDEIVTGFASIRYRNLLHKLGDIQLPMIRQLDKVFLRLAQRALERRHARARRSMQQFDEHIGDAMAFTGAME